MQLSSCAATCKWLRCTRLLLTCKYAAGSSTANATIPAGLQLILQDASGKFLCKQPLGFGSDFVDGIKTNNWLVQTSNKFQASSHDLTGSSQDCETALQRATAIGFQSLWGGVTFCVDAMQLV